MRTIQHWIGGAATSGSKERTAPVFNPATGQQQADVLLASAADVEAAVTAAKDAFAGWSQTSLSKRTKVLFAFRPGADGLLLLRRLEGLSVRGQAHPRPEGVSFYTRAKVITARWPRPEHAGDASFHFPTSK